MVSASWPCGIVDDLRQRAGRELDRELPAGDLDYEIALNEEHLRRILRDYVMYFHEDRLHDSLEKGTPNRRIVEQRPGVKMRRWCR
jgi:hypothetical protein